MRILFTADIHLGYERSEPGSRNFLENLSRIKNLDAIVIAGDVAENGPESTDEIGKHHRTVFELLKKTGCPNIAFCAGSHDIWCLGGIPDSWEIFQNALFEMAKEFGFIYLEHENLYLGETAIVGTMAHYDYSMAEEGLVSDGITVRTKHYRIKIPPGYDAPVWGDALYIKWQHDDISACNVILEDFEKRLSEANEKSKTILVASHTVPIPDVNGHIFNTNLKKRFLNAFCGTNHLNEILLRQNKSGKIKEAVSGHTHIKIGPIIKNQIKYRNIGGDYGSPRYEIIEV